MANKLIQIKHRSAGYGPAEKSQRDKIHSRARDQWVPYRAKCTQIIVARCDKWSVDILMPQTASRYEKETPQTANIDDHATNKNVEHGQIQNQTPESPGTQKQGNVCKQEMTPNPEINMKKSPRSPGTKVNRLGPQLGSRHQAKMSHTQK